MNSTVEILLSWVVFHDGTYDIFARGYDESFAVEVMNNSFTKHPEDNTEKHNPDRNLKRLKCNDLYIWR